MGIWKNVGNAIADFLASLANPVTVDQYVGLIRQAIPFVSGILLTLGLASSSVSNITADILLISGPALAFAGAVWSLIANNRTSILKAAAKNPEVRQIKVSSDATAESVPSDKVVNAP